MTENRLANGKLALVTGANKGIGLAIARGLGAAGFRVAVGARDAGRRKAAVQSLRADGVDAFGVALDVTSEQSVADAAAAIEAETGRLDVLVNNAGISGEVTEGGQDPTTLSVEVLRTVLETNVYGALRVTNAMLPLLERSASPRIVNMSSNMGSLELHTGPLMAAYSSSKTMLNALAVQYARRFAETPILINSACPGYVATDFTGHASERMPEQGAAIALRLATLPQDGPRGGFFDDAGPIPW